MKKLSNVNILGELTVDQSTFLIGSVGIGTTSPGAKLDVTGGSVQLSTSGSGVYFGPSSAAQIIGVSGASSYLSLGTVGTEKVRITSNGNVGIGTSSPVGKLNINTGTSGVSVDVANQSSGTISFANGSGGTAVPNIVGKSSNNVGLNIIAATPDVPAAGVDMQFYVQENDGTDFATITSTAFRFGRYTTPLFNILRNGNVGIGTTSPVQKLHVAGAIYSTAFVYGEAHLAFTEFRVRNNENYRLGTNGTDFRLNSVNDIVLSTTTSYTERMRITSSGNVGIGTVSPSEKLEVNGTIASIAASDPTIKVQGSDVNYQ